jgi:tRNA(fMet)-specific endonuclease VapC
MLRYMLDTNIVIYTMKNEPTVVRAAFRKHDGRMCISSITYMELVYGVEHSSNPERNLMSLEGLVERMEVLPLGNFAAAHAGQISAKLANQGMSIGTFDQLIAGHERSLGLALVTNNEKEFLCVSELMLQNWVSH